LISTLQKMQTVRPDLYLAIDAGRDTLLYLARMQTGRPDLYLAKMQSRGPDGIKYADT
jgi:hypothetical protein